MLLLAERATPESELKPEVTIYMSITRDLSCLLLLRVKLRKKRGHNMQITNIMPENISRNLLINYCELLFSSPWTTTNANEEVKFLMLTVI